VARRWNGTARQGVLLLLTGSALALGRAPVGEDTGGAQKGRAGRRCYAEGQVVERAGDELVLQLAPGDTRRFTLSTHTAFLGPVLSTPSDVMSGMDVGIEYVPGHSRPPVTRAEFAPSTWPHGCWLHRLETPDAAAAR